MFKFILVLTLGSFFVQAHALKQNKRYSKFDYVLYGQKGDKNEIDGVSVDSHGHVVLGGPFQNTVEFNYTSNAKKTMRSRNGTDIFITKRHKNNNSQLWFTKFDSGKNDFMYDLSVDKKNDIIISGSIGGQITKEHGVGSRPDGNGYVAKLDGRTGKILWKTIFKNFSSGANEVVSDSKGNIIATVMGVSNYFHFNDKYKFRGTGKKDAFIVKLSPSGKIKWVYPFLGNGNKQIRAIGINKYDQIIFGLEYIGQISFPKKWRGNASHSSDKKKYQGLAGVLSSNGRLEVDLSVKAQGFSNVRGAGADSKGDFYFTGVVTGRGKIGNYSVVGSNKGSSFLVKMSRSGQMRWVRVLHGEGSDSGSELIVTKKNSIVLTNSTSSKYYNVHDSRGRRLQSNISKTNHPRITRSVITIFNTSGFVIETYSPTFSGGSVAGVLEDSSVDKCLAVQFRFRGRFDHPISKALTLRKRDDYAVSVSKLCPLN